MFESWIDFRVPYELLIACIGVLIVLFGVVRSRNKIARGTSGYLAIPVMDDDMPEYIRESAVPLQQELGPVYHT
jgi:hypothetical protein